MTKGIHLGDRIKDDVTGLEGIATGMTEYLNGCRQWLIKPERLHEEKTLEGTWIDEQTLRVVKQAVFSDPFALSQKPKGGGPERPEGQRLT